MKREAVAALLIAVGSTAWAGAAQGAPRPRKKVAPRASGLVVLVASRQSPKLAHQVARAIRNHLVDVPARFQLQWVDRLPPGLPAQVVVARRVGRRSRAMVVLWCSHATVDQVFLYITRFRQGRILVRQVDRSSDGALGRFEAIGAIVRSGVEAILQGARIGVRPPPPPRLRRAAPPRRAVPRPPDRPGHRIGLALEVGYELTGFAPEAPLLHAGAVGLALTVHPNWALRLGYRFAPAVKARRSAESIELQLFAHIVQAGGAFRYAFGRWTLSAQLGLALSIQTWSADAPPPLVARPDDLDWTLGVEARACLSVRLRPWLALYGGLGATVLVWNRDYIARVGGEHLRVLSPFPVQPQLSLGLRFDLL